MKGSVIDLFRVIPISLPVGLLLWFFLKVVLGRENTFLELWRNSYLVILVVQIGWRLLWFALSSWAIQSIMRSFSLSYADVYDAYIVYKLQETKPINEWSREWLEQELAINRISASFAEAMIGVLHKHRRH
jgi:hypothetical protein